MKDTKTKIDNARALGFLGGVIFANAVHAAIVLPAVALHLGAKGKHNLHRAHGHHGPHETNGPVHFLAEQAKDERALLADIKADLDDIKKGLKEHHEPEPPKPDEGPEPPEPGKDGPEPPKPDEEPEPPKP